SLFLLRLTPPLRPRRLPYTTLFRSQHPAHVLEHQVLGIRVQMGGRGPVDVQQHRTVVLHAEAGGPGGDGDRGVEGAPSSHLHPEDRKSTRLNSSHVSISYAVFCLKK